jgi:ABC-2 type transport system ATP-binding protein
MTEPAIQTVALSKRYDRVQALGNVSITAAPGEVFGLLGPNGAGKTTLIKLLVGSSRPTAGSVRVLGADPFAQPRLVRQQVGYMPQASALYEDLSARDNLEFFARAQATGDVHRRVDEALELTELRTREHDPVFTFSGGMKQRLSLACALLHRPRILILDEPTAGVDPKLRETFWRHFRDLAAQGTTILVSTHQMDEALLCDRLAILRAGELLACEPPRDLLRRAETRLTVRRGDAVETQAVANEPEHIAMALRRYGLDPAVTGVQVDSDGLETIVLRMIDAHTPETDAGRA